MRPHPGDFGSIGAGENEVFHVVFNFGLPLNLANQNLLQEFFKSQFDGRFGPTRCLRDDPRRFPCCRHCLQEVCIALLDFCFRPLGSVVLGRSKPYGTLIKFGGGSRPRSVLAYQPIRLQEKATKKGRSSIAATAGCQTRLRI